MTLYERSHVPNYLGRVSTVESLPSLLLSLNMVLLAVVTYT